MTKIQNYLLALSFGLFVIPFELMAVLKKAQIHQLFEIHQTHRVTFFCGQSFQENGELVLPRCKSCPTSALKIQWMPIIPLTTLASHLPCYHDKVCLDKQAKPYGGLRCCEKISPQFKEMSIDLFNYVPENPTLIRLKGRYSYGEFSDISQSQTGCQFTIDKKRKQVATHPNLRGAIARTYLYFHQHYQLPLSPEEKIKYARWHQAFPLTDWERKRNQLIFERQEKHTNYLF